jgi:hypothetical protein
LSVFGIIKEGQLLCVERGFPNESSKSQGGDKREEDEKRDDYFSLQKRELLLSFFAAELFFFLHSPFDFVREMETDGQKRSSSNLRKVLHTKRTHRTYHTSIFSKGTQTARKSD